MTDRSDKLGIVLNPAAGRGKAALFREKLESMLRASERPFVWLESEYPGHAAKLVDELDRMKIRTIIACGGDGTINEMGSALVGKKQVRFGIVPLGMGNDYIRSAGIPRDPEAALRLILDDDYDIIPSDAGQINDRYFFNNLGIGFDGAVVVAAERIRRMKNPYYAGVARHIFTYREFPAVIRSEGKVRMDDRIFMFVASIGKAYGGGFYITPEAELADGLADVIVVPATRSWRRLHLLWLVSRKKHVRHPAFRFFRSREMEMDLGDHMVDAHLDGIRAQFSGTVRIRVIPGALHVITRKEQP